MAASSTSTKSLTESELIDIFNKLNESYITGDLEQIKLLIDTNKINPLYDSPEWKHHTQKMLDISGDSETYINNILKFKYLNDNKLMKLIEPLTTCIRYNQLEIFIELMQYIDWRHKKKFMTILDGVVLHNSTETLTFLLDLKNKEDILYKEILPEDTDYDEVRTHLYFPPRFENAIAIEMVKDIEEQLLKLASLYEAHNIIEFLLKLKNKNDDGFLIKCNKKKYKELLLRFSESKSPKCIDAVLSGIIARNPGFELNEHVFDISQKHYKTIEKRYFKLVIPSNRMKMH